MVAIIEACQREYQREEVEWPAICKLSDQSVIAGTILNVSPGGIFFSPEIGYVDGEYVQSSYEDMIDNRAVFIMDERIIAQGSPVWSNNIGFGVKFNRL